jgi:hypothetical protein
MRNAYKILVGKSVGKRSLGGPRRIWEDNIKMDVWENRLGRSGYGSVVSSCEHGNELSGSIKGGEFLD